MVGHVHVSTEGYGGDALSGSEVATVSGYRMDVQMVIAPAAKAAGIQLYVPAEYGFPVDEGPNVVMKEVRNLVKLHGLAFTIFNTGMFSELLALVFGYQYDQGYMTVAGKGETPFSITARKDAARFVAHVLTTVPEHELAGARFRFEAERLSPLQIRDLAEKKLEGEKLHLE